MYHPIHVRGDDWRVVRCGLLNRQSSRGQACGRSSRTRPRTVCADRLGCLHILQLETFYLFTT